jgi:hypothetical protein
MAQILRELVAGVLAEHLRGRAEQVLERIDTGRVREPGEDDEYDNMQEDPSTSFSMVSLWISNCLRPRASIPQVSASPSSQASCFVLERAPRSFQRQRLKCTAC